ncbi:MAG: PIN domain-containing protein [Candidatus Eremiobacteraeota bacterium]|nr:PIN domain-containing protein [Candidatus Eremiobacteraeota bacterium]
MNAVDIFIDTNLLIYAHDRDAAEKHERAADLMKSFWWKREVPALSVQVLQEMHVHLVRKGVSIAQSTSVVERYLQWRVIDNSARLLRMALKVQHRWQLSFWDASIVAAAQQSGAKELWTEDLNPGQDFEGVMVVNPLSC